MWLADENIPGNAIAFMRAQGEDVVVAVAETCRGITVVSAEGMRQRPLPVGA